MKPFHVVHVRFWGQHRGYEIWHNNKPVVSLNDGCNLKRHEAYALAHNWNETQMRRQEEASRAEATTT